MTGKNLTKFRYQNELLDTHTVKEEKEILLGDDKSDRVHVKLFGYRKDGHVYITREEVKEEPTTPEIIITGLQYKVVSQPTTPEKKCRKVAEKIVDLTGYGQALHVNDILPDIRELIENLLEQERKTYEAKKADYEFRSVGEWVDYHSRMGATIIVKNNLPIEARYENPVYSVIRAGLSLTSK